MAESPQIRAKQGRKRPELTQSRTTLISALRVVAGVALVTIEFFQFVDTCYPNISLHFQPGPCYEPVGFGTAPLGVFISLVSTCTPVLSLFRPSFFASKDGTAA